MTVAANVLDARSGTLPSLMLGTGIEHEVIRLAKFKRPSTVEYIPLDLVTLFIGGDSASKPFPPSLPVTVSVPTFGGVQYWENSNTFNEIVSTRPLDRLLGRLRGYKLLDQNWNGYGGQRPSSVAVEDCIDFLRGLESSYILPKPMVGGDGEVGVFWEMENAYIEVGFRGKGFFEYLVSINGKDVEGVGLSNQIPRDLIDGLTHIQHL